MTFSQFLESKKIFSSRSPDYDLNLAGDYSVDENDAKHFLLPFAKKLKQFGMYCETMKEEMEFIYRDTASRLQGFRGEPSTAHVGRVQALRIMVGGDDSRQPNRSPRFVNLLRHTAVSMRTGYESIRRILAGRDDVSQLKIVRTDMLQTISDMENVLDNKLYVSTPLSEKITPNLDRILRFLKVGVAQINKIIENKTPIQKTTEPVGYYGRNYT